MVKSSTARRRGLQAQHRLRREDDQRTARAGVRLPAQQVEVRRRACAASRPSCCPRRTAAGTARCGPRSGPGPGPRSRAAAAARPRSAGPTSAPTEEMNSSMIVWAPLTKSPNCASQSTSASGPLDRVAVLEAHRRELATAASRRPRTGPGRRPGTAAASTPRRCCWSCSTACRWTNVPRRRVLAGQPHRASLQQQRAEGEQLAHRPVDAALAASSRRAAASSGAQLRVHGEALGRRDVRVADALEHLRRRPRSARRPSRRRPRAAPAAAPARARRPASAGAGASASRVSVKTRSSWPW